MSPDLRRRYRTALRRLDDKRKLDAMFVLMVAWLPTRRRIEWQFFKGPHLGECESSRAGHVIRIRRKPLEIMRDTLIHEYAHALADEECPDATEHHSDLWGMNFARCYRILEAHWDGPEW